MVLAPVPLEAEVMLILLALLVTLQAQPSPQKSELLPVPPASPITSSIGSREMLQPEACVTVRVLPEMAIVPVRAGPAFGSVVRLPSGGGMAERLR